MRSRTALRAVLALIGFTAILAQIVLMRELMVVFYGNEISLGIILANWLLWTALGSGVLGRLAGRARNPQNYRIKPISLLSPRKKGVFYG